MKFVHLSDLHLGKSLNEHSFLEDQKYILNEIVDKIKDISPDFVIIAGDIYDRPIPSEGAVELLDDFLTELARLDMKVYMIAGNHDSAERLSFASELIEKSGIYISKEYDGKLKKFTLYDEYGPLNIFLLPFIKPLTVRKYHPENNISSYTDAVSAALSTCDINTEERNIVAAHQFITGAERSDSEDLIVGTIDNIDASLFRDFDYTALGHIHKPQNITEKIRYCGTPIKYSFSEAGNKNSITVCEIKEKGSLEITEIPLVPLRDMHEIEGKFQDIISSNHDKRFRDSYIKVILTDDESIYDDLPKLREIYPNILFRSYNNTRSSKDNIIKAEQIREDTDIIETFGKFFELQNNQKLNDEQIEYLGTVLKRMENEEE